MLFLGAGASAPFGIPTAPALTKEISGLVDRNVLDAINRFLTPFGREPNYEQILTLLVALTNSADVPKTIMHVLFLPVTQTTERITRML